MKLSSISIVIPIYNEADVITLLYSNIKSVMLNGNFEIVMINDGSIDHSARLIDDIANKDPRVKTIHFSRNYGQTAAIMAGFDYSSGDIVIVIDGDGQNDPKDIPRLLEEIQTGSDVVSGWRKNRQDKNISRKLPSFFANKIISWISGIKLRDYGCSLKAYRREVINNISLYGEMHRFIPIYAALYGAKVVEIPVSHNPRTTGQSKYGINRTFKVILDLLVVKFLQKFFTNPIYVMGGFGLLCLFVGFLVFIFAVVLKLFYAISFIQTPLLLVSVTFSLIGILSIMMGLIGEVIMRIYFESQSKRAYHIKSSIGFTI